MNVFDVAVLGGGIVGHAIAVELRRRGKSVVLLDVPDVREPDAGQTTVGLARPYTVAIEQLGREAARAVWETHRENHARLKEWLADLGPAARGVDLQPRGGFALALDRDEGKALAESEDVLREDGFSGEFFDHYMLEARFDVRGFAGGYWAVDGGGFHAPAFVAALAGRAREAGARLVETSAVSELETSAHGVRLRADAGEIEAETVVLANATLAAVVLPAAVEGLPRSTLHEIDATLDASHEIPQPGHLVSGRAWWERPADHRLTLCGEDAAADIEAFAVRHFPGAQRASRGSRMSAVRRTADGFPWIGPAPGAPCILALGLSGLDAGRYGLLAARWVAEAIASGRDETPALYRASRGLSLS